MPLAIGEQKKKGKRKTTNNKGAGNNGQYEAISTKERTKVHLNSVSAKKDTTIVLVFNAQLKNK